MKAAKKPVHRTAGAKELGGPNRNTASPGASDRAGLPAADRNLAQGSAGPAADGERKAHDVDPERKAANLRRLRRIEGQVGGLLRMVEADRYCPDILVQVGSVEQALRGVARELMRHHLEHCARRAFRGSEAEATAMIGELVKVWSEHAR